MTRIIALAMNLILIMQSAVSFNINDLFLSGYNKYNNLKYGTHTQQTLDLYIPKNNDGEIGLVLYIHGGTWKQGSKDSYDDKVYYYAEKGYAAATMNYRLVSSGANASQMLNDVTYALEKIKSTAEKDGVIINKVMLIGLSAGAHIALLYAYTQQKYAPIDPVAVVAYCPPSDLCDDNLYLDSCLGSAEYMASIMSGLCGVNFTYNSKGKATGALKKISPYYYINSNTVPTLLCHGKLDEAVPYAQSVRFVQKLDSFEVPHNFVPFLNSGHTLDKDADKTRIFNKYIEEYTFVYLN